MIIRHVLGKLFGIIGGLLLVGFCSAGLACAQQFSGTYTLTQNGVTLELILEQDAYGKIDGRLSSTTGIGYQVEGMIQDGIGVGTCYNEQGGVYFEAQPQGNQLIFMMIEPGANNMPDYGRVKELLFARRGEPVSGAEQGVENQGQLGTEGAIGLVPQGTGAPERTKLQEIGSEGAGDPNWGFEFTPPSGWKWQKDQTGILLGHDSVPGLIWVFPHDESNLQVLAQQMQKGLAEQGVLLSLASPLQPRGKDMLVGEYTGVVQGQQARGRGIGTLSPYGGGAYILAVTTPDKFGEQLAGAADAIAGGMRYFKMDVSELVRHFAGRWASYSGGAGGGTLVNYTFYPDGTFSDQSETSYSGQYSSDGWSMPDTSWGATGVSQSRARWKARGNKKQGQIIIMTQDGSQNVINYQVFVEKGETYWREYLFDGRHFSKQEDF